MFAFQLFDEGQSEHVMVVNAIRDEKGNAVIGKKILPCYSIVWCKTDCTSFVPRYWICPKNDPANKCWTFKTWSQKLPVPSYLGDAETGTGLVHIGPEGVGERMLIGLRWVVSKSFAWPRNYDDWLNRNIMYIYICTVLSICFSNIYNINWYNIHLWKIICVDIVITTSPVR